MTTVDPVHVHTDGPADDGFALRAVPDLRGIKVEDASGILIGRLAGSLAEAATGLLRYFDLDLESRSCHILVPIGHARVREMPQGDDPHIRLRAALLEDLELVPAGPADVAHIDDPFERQLLAAYGRTFHGERYYAHPSYDHSGLFVGDQPVVPESAGPDQPLTHLSYMRGWRVADGEPDIRRWHLQPDDLPDDVEIVIRDLIVDPAAATVRYIVVELPDRTARLLPVGFLNVDVKRELVTASGLTIDDLEALPAHDGGGVTRAEEERLMNALRERPAGARKYVLPDYRG